MSEDYTNAYFPQEPEAPPSLPEAPEPETKPFSQEERVELLYDAVRFLLELRVDEGDRLKNLKAVFEG